VGDPRAADQTTGPANPEWGGPEEARINELSPELTCQVLLPAMHQKLLFRAAELVVQGWTRGRPPGTSTARGSGPPRRRPPRCASWARSIARYELLNPDVYDRLGLEVDAYDTAPCPPGGPARAPAAAPASARPRRPGDLE